MARQTDESDGAEPRRMLQGYAQAAVPHVGPGRMEKKLLPTSGSNPHRIPKTSPLQMS